MLHRVLSLGLLAALTACQHGDKDTDAKADTSAAERTTAQPTATSVAPVPTEAATGAAATGTAAAPAKPCVRCQTQEDFDAAQKKGSSCCPVSACSNDQDCGGGRVCCRIPGGTLCGNASRCAAADRVKASGPSGALKRACKKSSDCSEGGMCCDQGPGKPGQCGYVSDGIKGCKTLD